MYLSAQTTGMTHQIEVSDSKVIDLESWKTAFSGVDATLRTSDAREPDALIVGAEDTNAVIVDASTHVTAEVLTSIEFL